jgi:hypothetical protein
MEEEGYLDKGPSLLQAVMKRAVCGSIVYDLLNCLSFE